MKNMGGVVDVGWLGGMWDGGLMFGVVIKVF